MEHPERKSIRLKGYDYSTPGYYFVTICTHHRSRLFGSVSVGADSECDTRRNSALSVKSAQCVHLSDAGKMIDTTYRELETIFGAIVLHEHIVMPDHIHGIIQICSEACRTELLHDVAFESAPTLARIIQTLKRLTTIRYIESVRSGLFEPFEQKVWQRGYNEHVIRNEEELYRIRQYITDNPATWKSDEDTKPYADDDIGFFLEMDKQILNGIRRRNGAEI